MKRHRPCLSFLSLCFVSVPAIAQFSLLYPSMPTDALEDIVFTDSLNGCFSNAAGTVFRTTNGGLTWDRRVHYQGDPATMLRFVDPLLGFAASPHSSLWLDKVSCLFTTDGGVNWRPADLDFNDASDFLPLSESVVLKGNLTGIARLDNVFALWTETYTMPWFIAGDVGVPYGTVQQLFRRSDSTVMALVSFENAEREGILSDSLNLLLRSENRGVAWDTLWTGSSTLMSAISFISDSVGWMGGDDATILKTSNGGRTWHLQLSEPNSDSRIQQFIVLDTLRVFAVSRDGRVFKTTDGGKDWSFVQVDEYPPESSFTKRRIAFIDSKKGFYAGSGLYETTDGGVNWRNAFPRIHEDGLHIDFINRQLGFALTSGGFYASRNGGVAWTKRSATQGWISFDMIDSLDGWAVGYSLRSRTTDGGLTWTNWNLDSGTTSAVGVQFYNKQLGVIFGVLDGTPHTSFLVTTDGGQTWVKRPITNRDYPSSWFKVKFTGPNHLWFANQQGLWHSRDTARTWTIHTVDSLYGSYVFDVQDTLRSICEIFPNSLASSSDGGLSWATFQKPYMNQALDLAILGHTYAGARTSIVVGQEGSAFEEDEVGLPMYVLDTYTLAPLNQIAMLREGSTADVWVLSSSFEILHTTIEFPDAVEKLKALPLAYQLFENYPNPFNPKTGVRYQVPGVSDVKITVFDILGREVEVLVDEKKSAGTYEVSFDGSRLASGVYICRMTAGNFTKAMKMVLVK